MKLYHGTNVDFACIDLAKSRVGKDFGVGFYLTPDLQVAEKQAARKHKQFGTGGLIVKVYEWEKEEGLSVLRFDGYTLEWAKFILANRNNTSRQQIHSYDVVIGPIADDTVGLQIRRFEDGIISLEQFLTEIKFHQVTMQYFFGTEQSIKTLVAL